MCRTQFGSKTEEKIRTRQPFVKQPLQAHKLVHVPGEEVCGAGRPCALSQSSTLSQVIQTVICILSHVYLFDSHQNVFWGDLT